jgi:hypothetical protein
MAAAGEIRCEHSTNGGIVLDVLYRSMRPASYRCIAEAIEIAIDSPACFVAVDSLLPTTIAKKHSNN